MTPSGSFRLASVDLLGLPSGGASFRRLPGEGLEGRGPGARLQGPLLQVPDGKPGVGPQPRSRRPTATGGSTSASRGILTPSAGKGTWSAVGGSGRLTMVME